MIFLGELLFFLSRYYTTEGSHGQQHNVFPAFENIHTLNKKGNMKDSFALDLYFLGMNMLLYVLIF